MDASHATAILPARLADVVRGTTDFDEASPLDDEAMLTLRCMFHAVEAAGLVALRLVLWRCLDSVILPISPRSRLIDHILG